MVANFEYWLKFLKAVTVLLSLVFATPSVMPELLGKAEAEVVKVEGSALAMFTSFSAEQLAKALSPMD